MLSIMYSATLFYASEMEIRIKSPPIIIRPHEFNTTFYQEKLKDKTFTLPGEFSEFIINFFKYLDLIYPQATKIKNIFKLQFKNEEENILEQIIRVFVKEYRHWKCNKHYEPDFEFSLESNFIPEHKLLNPPKFVNSNINLFSDDDFEECQIIDSSDTAKSDISDSDIINFDTSDSDIIDFETSDISSNELVCLSEPFENFITEVAPENILDAKEIEISNQKFWFEFYSSPEKILIDTDVED